MNIHLLRTLLDYMEQYEQETTREHANIAHFADWLSKATMPKNDVPQIISPQNIDIMLCKWITAMYRYVKVYSRKAFKDTAVGGIDEFVYLMHLFAEGNMSKTTLFEKNIHEKPTGIQIINRLIQQGFIEQTDYVHDKRSKELSITQKGRGALMEALPPANSISQLAVGVLTDAEKGQLFQLLKKLDDFHQPIFLSNAIEDKEGINKVLLRFSN
jgi:MarR family transcriptional regulator, lower aerobic nicotinate degradation pathway regulator